MPTPTHVLFVHGYSEGSLGAYFQFPSILKAAVPEIQRVALSAFDSLDDGISIDDLADALEASVASLMTGGNWSVPNSALICHSTGALVARRWILNRLGAGKETPSHLITLAGANHGSSLAGMGKSVLGYLQKLALHHELSVGQQVLDDLEYGSDFLLKLNADWLRAWNGGQLDGLYAFSMGGDTPGKDPTMDIFWQTHEPGTDNTVRISGANLNYTIISVDHDENATSVSADYPTRRRAPHLVVPGYSHYGPQTGILGNVRAPGDPPMAATIEALKTSTPDSYGVLEQQWSAATADWTAKNTGNANATAIFDMRDRDGTPIDDCMIAILDQKVLGATLNADSVADTQARTDALVSASTAIIPHSPIHNDAQTGAYAFYLNYGLYLNSSPHWFHIEFGESSLIGQYKYPYGSMIFTQPPELQHTIAPNEATYIRITIGRTSNAAYAIYGWDAALDLESTTFPPFNQNVQYRLAPPPP